MKLYQFITNQSVSLAMDKYRSRRSMIRKTADMIEAIESNLAKLEGPREGDMIKENGVTYRIHDIQKVEDSENIVLVLCNERLPYDTVPYDGNRFMYRGSISEVKTHRSKIEATEETEVVSIAVHPELSISDTFMFNLELTRRVYNLTLNENGDIQRK